MQMNLMIREYTDDVSKKNLMERRALLVGIDSYNNLRNLTGCVADAAELHGLLERNEDGSPNYVCRLITSAEANSVTRVSLKREWQRLFYEFTGDALFYFSGHSAPDETGGYLCVEDSTQDDPGVNISDLLRRVNHSKAREVLLILDACYGMFPGRSPRLRDAITEDLIQLREGVTILSAAAPTGVAMEINGRGVFTNLLTEALAGGAADIRGFVTAASAYNYIEQGLSVWGQRPIFQSNVSKFSPLRRCKSTITDELLRELLIFFPTPDYRFRLDPSYESTHKSAVKGKVEILNKFRLYRDAHLLCTVKGKSFYLTALSSNYVQLTALGQFYWRLAKIGRV